MSAAGQPRRPAAKASPTALSIVGTNHMTTRVISRWTCRLSAEDLLEPLGHLAPSPFIYLHCRSRVL
jgi:hypothetical protein